MKNSLRKAAQQGSILLVISLATSCANINPTAVSDADRDTSGAFDGAWKLAHQPLDSEQTFAQQRFRCKFIKRSTELNVVDGVGTVVHDSYSGQGNISKNGRFRISVATDLSFRTSSNHDAEGNKITYIFQGSLRQNKRTGLFTIGKKSLNNSGCSTRLSIFSSGAKKEEFPAGRARTRKVLGSWSFAAENIPGVQAPSKLTHHLTIKRDGKHFFGQLEINMSVSSQCGELRSVTRTPISANLIKNRLILSAMEKTPTDEVSCGAEKLSASTFGKYEKITFDLVKGDSGSELKSLDTCGWKVDGQCVFTKPPLSKE